MASSYSTSLKIELIGTGEQSGTWGSATNTNLGTAVEQAIVGKGNPVFSTDADLTITLSNSSAAQTARAFVLTVTSGVSLTATRNLVVPTIEKPYVVMNNTTGGRSIVVKTSAGTGITVPNGARMFLYVDGANVLQMLTKDSVGLGNVDNTSDASKPISTATQAALDLKANASSVAAAVSGPASATDNALVRFDGTTGKLVQSSNATVDDSGNATFSGNSTAVLSKAGQGFHGIGDGCYTGWGLYYEAGSWRNSVSGQGGWAIAKGGNTLTMYSGVTAGAAGTAVSTPAVFQIVAGSSDITFLGSVFGVTKSMVGLGNVDNTSDANKPVSTATQTALNAKAPLTGSGTSGTWPISVSGNAATVSNGVYTNVDQAITAAKRFDCSDTAIANAGGGLAPLEARGTGGAAFMTFHRPSAHAAYFGLDSDNQWKVGGWSMGAVSYKLWHAGNDGSGSGLDADVVRGAAPSTSVVGGTLAQRTAEGYLFGNYFNMTADTQTVRPSRVAIETGSDGYLRWQNLDQFTLNLRMVDPMWVVSSSTTASLGYTHVLTASLTLTLPPSPGPGWRVGVVNRSGTTTCVIARNGQNIMGLAEDMTLDNLNASLTLIFADATRGWVWA